MSELPLFGQATSNTLSCTIVQATWGLGYIVLLTIAMFFSAIILKRLWHLHQSSPQAWDLKARQTAILQFARLMLLITAAITILLYVMSPVAAFAPWPTSRYLVGQLVSIPAVIWPLWSIRRGLSGAKHSAFQSFAPTASAERSGARFNPSASTDAVSQWPHTSQWGRSALNLAPAIFKLGILLLVSIVFVSTTIYLYTAQITPVQVINQQQETFVHDLLHIGATRIYTDYWTCDRVVLQSNEQIICSVLDNNLNPTENRYTAYSAAVQADPDAAYVFPDGSPQALAIARRIAQSGRHYTFSSFDGFVIYQPAIAHGS
jgi:hypothetical protein